MTYTFRKESKQNQKLTYVWCCVDSVSASDDWGRVIGYKVCSVVEWAKDTNRKIRKTEFIYICGSKNGSSSSIVIPDEVWGK